MLHPTTSGIKQIYKTEGTTLACISCYYNLYNSSFWSSILIGSEECNILVILELQLFYRLFHSA